MTSSRVQCNWSCLPGDNPLYHPVPGEFSATEGFSSRTCGRWGDRRPDQRGFVARAARHSARVLPRADYPVPGNLSTGERRYRGRAVVSDLAICWSSGCILRGRFGKGCVSIRRSSGSSILRRARTVSTCPSPLRPCCGSTCATAARHHPRSSLTRWASRRAQRCTARSSAAPTGPPAPPTDMLLPRRSCTETVNPSVERDYPPGLRRLPNRGRPDERGGGPAVRDRHPDAGFCGCWRCPEGLTGPGDEGRAERAVGPCPFPARGAQDAAQERMTGHA